MSDLLMLSAQLETAILFIRGRLPDTIESLGRGPALQAMLLPPSLRVFAVDPRSRLLCLAHGWSGRNIGRHAVGGNADRRLPDARGCQVRREIQAPPEGCLLLQLRNGSAGLYY